MAKSDKGSMVSKKKTDKDKRKRAGDYNAKPTQLKYVALQASTTPAVPIPVVLKDAASAPPVVLPLWDESKISKRTGSGAPPGKGKETCPHTNDELPPSLACRTVEWRRIHEVLDIPKPEEGSREKPENPHIVVRVRNETQNRSTYGVKLAPAWLVEGNGGAPVLSWSDYLVAQYRILMSKRDELPAGTFLYENIFPQDKMGVPQYQPSGKYLVRIWHHQHWRSLAVDDWVPVDANKACLLPGGNHWGEIWPVLLAKALLILHPKDVREDGGCGFISSLCGWVRSDIALPHPSLLPTLPPLPTPSSSTSRPPVLSTLSLSSAVSADAASGGKEKAASSSSPQRLKGQGDGAKLSNKQASEKDRGSSTKASIKGGKGDKEASDVLNPAVLAEQFDCRAQLSEIGSVSSWYNWYEDLAQRGGAVMSPVASVEEGEGRGGSSSPPCNTPAMAAVVFASGETEGGWRKGQSLPALYHMFNVATPLSSAETERCLQVASDLATLERTLAAEAEAVELAAQAAAAALAAEEALARGEEVLPPVPAGGIQISPSPPSSSKAQDGPAQDGEGRAGKLKKKESKKKEDGDNGKKKSKKQLDKEEEQALEAAKNRALDLTALRAEAAARARDMELNAELLALPTAGSSCFPLYRTNLLTGVKDLLLLQEMYFEYSLGGRLASLPPLTLASMVTSSPTAPVVTAADEESKFSQAIKKAKRRMSAVQAEVQAALSPEEIVAARAVKEAEEAIQREEEAKRKREALVVGTVAMRRASLDYYCSRNFPSPLSSLEFPGFSPCLKSLLLYDPNLFPARQAVLKLPEGESPHYGSNLSPALISSPTGELDPLASTVITSAPKRGGGEGNGAGQLPPLPHDAPPLPHFLFKMSSQAVNVLLVLEPITTRLPTAASGKGDKREKVEKQPEAMLPGEVGDGRVQFDLVLEAFSWREHSRQEIYRSSFSCAAVAGAAVCTPIMLPDVRGDDISKSVSASSPLLFQLHITCTSTASATAKPVSMGYYMSAFSRCGLVLMSDHREGGQDARLASLLSLAETVYQRCAAPRCLQTPVVSVGDANDAMSVVQTVMVSPPETTAPVLLHVRNETGGFAGATVAAAQVPFCLFKRILFVDGCTEMEPSRGSSASGSHNRQKSNAMISNNDSEGGGALSTTNAGTTAGTLISVELQISDPTLRQFVILQWVNNDDCSIVMQHVLLDAPPLSLQPNSKGYTLVAWLLLAPSSSSSPLVIPPCQWFLRLVSSSPTPLSTITALKQGPAISHRGTVAVDAWPSYEPLQPLLRLVLSCASTAAPSHTICFMNLDATTTVAQPASVIGAELGSEKDGVHPMGLMYTVYHLEAYNNRMTKESENAQLRALAGKEEGSKVEGKEGVKVNEVLPPVVEEPSLVPVACGQVLMEPIPCPAEGTGSGNGGSVDDELMEMQPVACKQKGLFVLPHLLFLKEKTGKSGGKHEGGGSKGDRGGGGAGHSSKESNAYVLEIHACYPTSSSTSSVVAPTPAANKDAVSLDWSMTNVGGGGVVVSQDQTRMFELSGIKASWEKQQAGRAKRAKQARDAFLSSPYYQMAVDKTQEVENAYANGMGHRSPTPAPLAPLPGSLLGRPRSAKSRTSSAKKPNKPEDGLFSRSLRVASTALPSIKVVRAGNKLAGALKREMDETIANTPAMPPIAAAVFSTTKKGGSKAEKAAAAEEEAALNMAPETQISLKKALHIADMRADLSVAARQQLIDTTNLMRDLFYKQERQDLEVDQARGRYRLKSIKHKTLADALLLQLVSCPPEVFALDHFVIDAYNKQASNKKGVTGLGAKTLTVFSEKPVRDPAADTARALQKKKDALRGKAGGRINDVISLTYASDWDADLQAALETVVQSDMPSTVLNDLILVTNTRVRAVAENWLTEILKLPPLIRLAYEQNLVCAVQKAMEVPGHMLTERLKTRMKQAEYQLARQVLVACLLRAAELLHLPVELSDINGFGAYVHSAHVIGAQQRELKKPAIAAANENKNDGKAGTSGGGGGKRGGSGKKLSAKKHGHVSKDKEHERKLPGPKEMEELRELAPVISQCIKAVQEIRPLAPPLETAAGEGGERGDGGEGEGETGGGGAVGNNGLTAQEWPALAASVWSLLVELQVVTLEVQSSGGLFEEGEGEMVDL